ncbi:M16 family metallopeptidase [Pseudomonadota bacterium]
MGIKKMQKQFANGLAFGLLALGLLLSPLLLASPNIQTWQTENGAKVLYVEAPELPMVDVRVLFDAGSARDGDKPGLAKLTAGLMTEGAGEWNADQIAERLEDVGAQLGGGSARDMAWVSVRTLTEAKALEVSLETLAAILARPRFDEADFSRLREAMQVGLRQSEQNPGSVASKAFFAEVFAGHPYGTHPGGTQESLAAMTREDLLAMHKRYFVARNGVVAIVGAVDRAKAEQIAKRVTKGLAAGEHAPAMPEVGFPEKGGENRIAFPSSQSHILIGHPGMHRGDPDYFALYVGNHILGGGGLVSQLSDEVREKRGLSYSVYSYFQPMRRNGPFTMGAQTKNAQAAEAMAVMRQTLDHFIENGPTEDELTAAKQNITGSFPLRIASNSSIVEYLSVIGFYDLPLDYLDAFVGKVNDVTVEKIRDAFRRRVQPEKFVTVVVGNGNEVADR